MRNPAINLALVTWSILSSPHLLFAQDAGSGGWIQNFIVTQRFDAGDNLFFQSGRSEFSVLSLTDLDYSLVTETRTQRLVFGISSTFGLGDDALGGTDFRLTHGGISLNYTREAANASLETQAAYNRNRIETLDYAEVIFGDDGVGIDDDVLEVAGTGTRDNYVARAQLSLGFNDLIEYQIGVSTEGVLYHDTSDPDLFDRKSNQIFAQAEFYHSKRQMTTLRYSLGRYSDEGTDLLTRDTYSLDIRHAVEWTQNARFQAAIRFDHTETGRGIGLGRTYENDSFVSGILNSEYDLVDGQIFGEVSSREDAAGRIHSLSAGRRFDFKEGSLTAILGLANAGSETDLIGRLDFSNTYGQNTINLLAERQIGSDIDDNIRTSDRFRATYVYDFNDRQSFSVAANYSSIQSATDDISVFDVNAYYGHALTKDWRLFGGIGYRKREEAGLANIEAARFTIALRREFQSRN